MASRHLRPQPLRRRRHVSVVVPCHGYGRYLPECVGSVLAQDGVDVDVTIVDDASPDDSAAVAYRLATADQRVRVLENERNVGHIATFNRGLSAVDGDHVVLLSADDMLTPGSLSRSVALLDAHPEVGMVYGWAPQFTHHPPAARTRSASWSIWSGPDWLEQLCRGAGNPVTTPDVVLRGSLMRELRAYDARVPHACDLLMWLRAATRTSIGRINGADQAFYRVHGANMHTEQYGGAFTDLAQRVLAFQIAFAEDGQRLPDVARLRRLAYRALARECLMLAQWCREFRRHEAEPLDELVALAEQLGPAAEHPDLWRGYERHLARAAAGLGPPMRFAVAAMGDVYGRWRWRRWRRSGVLRPARSI